MKTVKLTRNNCQVVVKQACAVLKQHGLVVFPSDTVYGLAANALSEQAVKKLYQFKNRPVNQSVAIATSGLEEAKKYFEISDTNKNLLTTLLPGPYTVILNSKQQVITKLEAEDKTLGLRIPNYFFTKKLSQTLFFPYTVTSANLHGKGPHYSVEALINTLSNKKKQLLDLIIDYGKLPNNPPSTVVNLATERIQTLRQGRLLFKPVFSQNTTSAEQTQALAKKILTKIIATAKNKAIVIILQGDLGTGKTVFTKGIGQFLNTKEIISPTYTLYYEYLSVNNIIKKLHHFDLYRVENSEELETLQIKKLLKPNNLLVFEWGEKLGSFINLVEKQKASIVLITLKETAPQKRDINVYQLS